MRVLVVGDVIVDRYIHGKKLGVSAETPTIVAEYEREELFLGGAGLVCRNLLRLGCEVVLSTIYGTDGHDVWGVLRNSSDPASEDEMKRFFSGGVMTEGWKLSEKRRYFVDGYKLLQYDFLNKGKWTEYLKETFLELFWDDLRNCDAVVICDNRHGMLDQDLGSTIVQTSDNVPVFVDCQISQNSGTHKWYSGATWMLLNEKEVNFYVPDPSLELRRKIEILEDHFDTQLVVKRGALGASTFDGDFPAPKVKCVDTCGAGDAFLAAFVESGGDIMKANEWAALSTTYMGTVVPPQRKKR